MKTALNKKNLAMCIAVAALFTLPLTASAADKLIIKDSTGTSDVFKVDDVGNVQLPVSTGIGRGSMFNNPSTLDNFAFVSASPDGSQPNQGMAYQMVPKGTGFNSNIVAQLSVFNTDFLADGVNYEALVLRSAGTRYSINATRAGTGLTRRIEFQMSNQPKMTLDTTGFVGIGTTAPTSPLQVVALPVYANNAEAIGDGLTAGAFYRTSTGVLMVAF